MATQLLIFLTLLSFLSVSSPLPADNIRDAASNLSISGYTSMALTLEFGSQSIIPPSSSLTIFSPPDIEFSKVGQPSLSLLQFHFSPLFFSPQSLKILPPGTKIPTLNANHSLIITSSSSDSYVSLNGVKINGSAIYNDGSLVVFGIEKFLDPDFEVSGSISGRPAQGFRCSGNGDDFHMFEEASGALRSRGYSIMASFLDLQLTEFKNQTFITIFAPEDEIMKSLIGNFTEYRSIFLRHFVPCKVASNDLANLENGVLLPTYLAEFLINVTRSGDTVLLSGVQVVAPDLYNNSWLAVHGLLRGSFVGQENSHQAPRSSSGGRRNRENIAADFMLWTSLSLLFLCIFYQNI